MFIRHQFAPYVIPMQGAYVDQYGPSAWTPSMHTPAPTPHGRNDYTGSPSDWGPDAVGYTDFDDYHLAIFGA